MKRHALRILPVVIGIALIFMGIRLNESNSASIGIIGGADGPTSIFVAGMDMFGPVILCVCAGVIILAVCLFRIIRSRKK